MIPVRRIVTRGLLAAVILGMGFELACQIQAARIMRRQHALRARPDHYYRPSENPVLVYELARDRTVEKEGRVLRLNRHGIRDDENGIPAADRLIAILGDSIVFGKGITQDQTLTAFLQSAMDPSGSKVRILNFGVPGYNLPELLEQLKVKDAIYRAHHIVYIFNPNDFCLRDTRYEGADNGMYRMYKPPILKSPWFLRKMIYQWRKEGVVSVGWYRWLYRGNRDQALGVIMDMASYAQARDAKFTVAFVPAGCAYTETGYLLEDVYKDLFDALTARGVEVISPIEAFEANPPAFFTDTDHLTVAGNQLMAEILARRLASEGAPSSSKSEESEP